MNKYLAVITTALVITQIVRVTQNAIQLNRIGVEPSDYEVHREVFRMLYEKLKREAGE